MIVSEGKILGFAPQALGETVPNLANGYFYSQNGLGLLGRFATYAALYKAQPSIATVVDKVAAAAARLTIKVWDTAPAVGRVQDKTSAYAKLIANPSTMLSPFNFYRWTFSTYEIYGEAFWYKQRRDQNKDAFGIVTQSGPVVNLLPMHPSRTAVHRDVDGNVEYIFTLGVASAGILRASAADVVPFLRYNPDSLMRGMSRLEPLRSTLLNEDASRRANESFWTKGARPSVLLKHPGSLTQAAQDRLKASFDARHAGADNVGGTAILEEGMDAVVVQLTSVEMQYIEGRKLNMTEVCMVFDVPPPVIHILDHATYSNITEQMRSMYRDTMSPRLEDIESVIDYELAIDFFPKGARETEFDMSEVLRGDFEGRTTAVVSLRNAGLITGNQGIEVMNFPRSKDPEMDKFYANATLVPLGAPAHRVSITEAMPPTPAEQAEAIHSLNEEEQAAAADQTSQASPSNAGSTDGGASKAFNRDVLGRFGRVKALSKPDIRKTAVAEHQKALNEFFAKQRAAVKGSASSEAVGGFDPSAWDGDLASILHTLSAATARAIGDKVAADLGGEYSSSEITAFLTSSSAASATRINATTADEIAAAFENAPTDQPPDDTVDQVFDGEITARTDQISMSRVAEVGGLASLVAARMSGARTKTWMTGPNPRATHAAMDGETVPLGELFSNGMDGPGFGGPDDANCNCDFSFSTDQ